jgi:copper transport protein
MRTIALRAGAVAAIVASALAWAAAPAAAHALPQSSDPAAGARVAKSPAAVSITFGETPDPRLSLIGVLDTSGANRTVGRTTAVAGDPRTLQVAVGALPDGVYTVSWRTVSEVDGHLASGSFAFGVGVTPAGASLTGGFTTKAPAPSATSVAARWLLYAGLMVLVGGAFVAVACLPVPPRRIDGLLGLGWLLAAIGTVAITVEARHRAGLGWSDLLGSSLGHEFLWRALPLLAVGGILIMALSVRQPRARRTLLALAAAGAAVAMWGDVEASHASAAQSLRLLRMADQWAHFAAAGIWAGGLVAVLVTIGLVPEDLRRRAASRYSLAALCSVIVVAGTGFQRAYDEIGSLRHLFHTAFGQSVLVKIALLGALVCLGALNRYRAVPRVRTSLRLLQMVGRTELILIGVVLVATGIIQGLAPPTSVASAPPVHPLALDGHDFGTTVRVRLTVSPGLVGFNTFTLMAADYDTGAPVTGTVTLGFTLPARPDLGSSSLALPQVKPGAYAGQGANLSIAGSWAVTATIQEPTGGVQVPFTVVPRTPPQRITVQPGGPGLPTLYTLQLPGNQSVQTYLDPGHPGFNEFHLTFFASASQELPMSAATVTAHPPHGPGTPLTVRPLDTIGHFVADVPGAIAGTYTFDVTGTTTTGGNITGSFTIPVK